MNYQKHTITIYSPIYSQGIELSALAREAEEGEAICTEYATAFVPEASLPEDAASFLLSDNEA